MRMFNEKLFDEIIYVGIGTYYTDPKWNALLGSPEKLVLHAIGDNAAATPSVTISTEHSNDNKNWDALTASVIAALAPTTTALAQDTGADTASCGAFRRLKIVITGASSSCHLVILGCGRGEQGGG